MEMNINGELVKILRTQRSWSQEELSSIAGLSLRTIQRIENEGGCSLESKKALASVFEIDARSLEIDKQAVASAIANSKGKLWGFIGVGLGLIGAYSGITFSLVTGSLQWGDAGIYYGVTGAFSGICAALIGVISKKQQNG